MTTDSSAAPISSPPRRYPWLLALGAGLLIGTLYAWCLTTNEFADQGYPFRWRYYPAMVEGWLQGRLDLPIPVPAGLLALPDPQDPQANINYRYGQNGVHDLTLFKRRVYMYWGPTPALIVFLPWRLLTHTALATPWAAWFFTLGGWLACAILLLRLARRHFPAVGSGVLFTLLLALGLCNWGPMLLRRADVYETAIAAEFFFLAVAWCCLVEYLWAEERRRVAWLVAAGAAYGLAVGARPNCIVGAAVLLLPLWLGPREERRWSRAVAALLPLAAAVAALLLLNYLRFGNPFDFGQRNQLAGVKVTGSTFFSPAYAWFNLRTYLFSPPRWGDYFPFILPPSDRPVPHGYAGTEGAYGLLATLPFLWLGGLIWLARHERRLLASVAFVAASAVLTLAFLIGFFGSATRYELEFAPALALLAAVGVLIWEQRAAARAWTRRIGRLVWSALLLVSVGTTMAASWEYSGFFAATDPATHDAFARAANQAAIAVGYSPAAALESVELEIKFPPAPRVANRLEVLLSTGVNGHHDAVVVDYPSADAIRLGFAHATAKSFTPPIPLDDAKSHVVRITLGSFLPPFVHSFWRNADPRAVQQVRSQVRVSLDGHEWISGTADLFDNPRTQPTIGALFDPRDELVPFSGTIVRKKEFWQLHP